MSYFTAKIHQIRFRLELCPRPRSSGGAYSATPNPLAGFIRGLLLGGTGGKRWDGTGGERREGRGGEGWERRGGVGRGGKGEEREGEGKEGSQSHPDFSLLSLAVSSEPSHLRQHLLYCAM